MELIVSGSDLDRLIRSLKEKGRVAGPVSRPTFRGRMVAWAEIRSIGEVVFDEAPRESMKRFLFPQPEVLLRFKRKGTGYEVEPGQVSQETVLFGVRPCDARSACLNLLPYQDDPFFLRNMAATVIVGTRCEQPCSTCFCRDVGGGPESIEGMDARITPCGEGSWKIELFTEKGLALFQAMAGGEPAPTPEGGAEKTPPLLKPLKSAPLSSLYESDVWAELARACLNCGICTFLCPTCYCFDIQDERLGSSGRRIRYWDSCMFPLFTQHASGHNPRPTKLHRVRNRFLHKLKYFPDRFGSFSCVGCGRCVRECPVGIDIRKVMKRLAEAVQTEV